MSKYTQIDLSKTKRYSIAARGSIVNKDLFARTGRVDTTEFLDCLPDILKAKDIKNVIAACKTAKAQGKAIVVGLGGHVIKCGLAPLLIELMKAGYVSAFMVNGSVVIHDFELAMFGQTSEDVASALIDGSFGMAIETGDGINNIINAAQKEQLGLGEAVGKALQDAPNRGISLLANAYSHDIPVTVHVALGTDIIHQHPSANGSAIGDCSLRDFRILCNALVNLDEGGVFLNFGSAVILPEVFLKALTVARNTGNDVQNFTTAVFDMNMHYRPMQNIVSRPTQPTGKGYYFVGHHEIMIPLFIKSLLYTKYLP